MPRLGELLVAAGVITAAQLEDGLRAQVIHGARLGTNLVELGHVELDEIAVALGRQNQLPPALRRHFERCDPDVQARLPAHLAAPHLVVPVGFLTGERARVMIAVRDRLPADALAAIERALGLGPGSAVQAICGELRILYYLERVYGVPRANRFLRVRRPQSADLTPTGQRHETFGGDTFGGHTGPWGGFGGEASGYRTFDDATGRYSPAPAASPPPEENEEDFDVDLDAEPSEDRATTSGFGLIAPFEPSDDFHIEETPIEHLVDARPRGHGRAPTDPPAELRVTEPLPEFSLAAIQNPLAMDGEEARRFVGTVADPAPLAAPTLARMKIRRVGLKASGELVEVDDEPSVVSAATTLDEVARAIRRGDSRDRVGDLALAALRRFGDGKLEAVILFVVREATAIGWKGHLPGSDVAIEDLAVPLDAPTVLAAAARERRALLIDGAQATEIDHRLWDAMGCAPPGQVAVAPVVLANHPVCLIYGQGPNLAPFAELFAAVTQATTTALARLLRAAQR